MTIRELQDLPASLFYGSQLVTDAGNFLCRFFFFYLKWSLWQRDTPWKAKWVIKVNSGLCVNSSFENKTHSSSFFQLNVQNVHQCPKHESKGFSQGWEIFYVQEQNLVLLDKPGLTVTKLIQGSTLRQKKEKWALELCHFLLSWHGTGQGLGGERSFSCHGEKAVMQVSTKSQFVLRVLEPKRFLLRTFSYCLGRTETQAPPPMQMFHSSTKLSWLGFVLAHLRKFPRFEWAACKSWRRDRRNQKDFYYWNRY